ncbi:MAG TPA: hypothetical protein VNL97_08990 [Solirubrobacterales bacterium]|nr:hypothetical protein [Solirubrobacterales bacterium]
MIESKTTTARWLCLTGLFMLVALIVPSVSSAEFEIVPGSVEIQTVDDEGNPDTRAGAHPDRLLVGYELDINGTATRDLAFEFGPGITGSPFATPVCERAVFENEGACPEETQVGVFNLTFGENEAGQVPLYNVAPTADRIANLGFVPFWQTEIAMTLRPTDLALRLSSTDMTQLPNTRGRMELWGIPADHVGGSERVPFLTTPPQCGPLKVLFKARSWEVGAPWVSETAETLPFTDCDLSFEPDFDIELSDPRADSPTGAHIDLTMADSSGPDDQISATLKEVKIDLPSGTTVSPGGAEGLDVCQDAQFGLDTENPVTCPLRSRVGTVELETPQLSEELTGSVFLGEERPGERFRLFVAAEDPGIRFKATGRLVTDPKTGELTTVLSNLPPVPLSRISLDLDNGPTALLASPLSCGPAPAVAHFVLHGPHEPVDSSAVVDIESKSGTACAGSPAFSPRLIAGSSRARAGESTEFSFTLLRRDGEQLMKKLILTLPEGVNANLTVVDICGNAAAETGACPASSRIGSAVAEVGSGESPALVRGDVYLTESYRGAPFGLSVVFDAMIGPFDLGSLNVRGMLLIDPHSGQHSLEIDPLPVIFEGVALRFLTVGIDLNRPGFVVSPTSCEPSQILASIHSVDGRTSSITAPFNLDGCDNLGFRPGFSLSVKNHRGGGKPELSFGVRSRKGEANLRQFKVKFPGILAFHSGAAKAICTRGDAAEDLCPAASRVGTGVSRSPLVGEPLKGPVYLVQPKGGGFPDFLISLVGGGVPLQLRGESSRQGGRLVTKMVDLPDIPLSTFTMNLDGREGLFSLKRDPCGGGRGLTSPVSLIAHDGAYREMHVPLKAGCGGKKRVGRQAPDRRR